MKHEILSLMTTWMDFEGIVLSEISQMEKDKYHMISLVWNIKNNLKSKWLNKPNKIKQLDTENRAAITRGEGLGMQNGIRGSTLWWQRETELVVVHAETLILWPPNAKSWLFWKHPNAGKDWGQEEKGTTEDEMVGWHHRLNGHEFG